MSSTRRLKGHLAVRQLKASRARVYYAYWRDESGEKHGERLGPALVRDTGRRTTRGAIIWRAGDGPKPTPAHLTPQDGPDSPRGDTEHERKPMRGRGDQRERGAVLEGSRGVAHGATGRARPEARHGR